MAQDRRRRRGESALPLCYFALALLVVVIALPSVLRPPQTPPSSTAELSPDAPPDESQQSLISSFSRGSSGTAGAGEGLGGDGDLGPGPGGVGGGGLGAPATPPPARGCPFGFGNPPRQTFSYFSAPCAPAWSGNNGGATWKGVTASEVRVAVGDPNGDHGTEGPVPDKPYPNENTADRTLRVWQNYFNTHYQFWGRRLQLVNINGVDNSDNAKQRAAAIKTDEVYHVFAADIGRFATMKEFARRQVIDWAEQGDNMAGSWLASLRPYAWTTRTDATRLMRLSAEFACKSLVGRPASHAGDPTLTSNTRVIGFLYYSNEAYRNSAGEFQVHVHRSTAPSP